MSDKMMVDEEALREQVRVKYREVAAHPYQTYHFHTGRPLACETASARAAYSRLKAAAGRVTPHRIAKVSDARLRRYGLTRQKASYCKNLASCIVDRNLSLSHLLHLDDHAGHSKLLQVPGIGPWTADIYLLMVLRRPDIWPDGDLALAKAVQQVKRLRSGPTQEELQRIARSWAPGRAVAARILWHYYLSSK